MPKRKNNPLSGIRISVIPIKSVISFVLIVITIVFFVGVLKTFISSYPYFNITKVFIIGVDDSYAGIARKLIGKNIFSLNLNALKTEIAKQLIDVECVFIQRRLPSELVISLRKRIAVAQLKLSRFYPIDQSAMIMGRPSDIPFEGLPIILGLDNKISEFNLRSELESPVSGGVTANSNTILRSKQSSRGGRNSLKVSRGNRGSKDGVLKPKIAKLHPAVEELKLVVELAQAKNKAANLQRYKLTKIDLSKPNEPLFYIIENSSGVDAFKNTNLNPKPQVEIRFQLRDYLRVIKVLGVILNGRIGSLENIEYIDLKNPDSPVFMERKGKAALG